MNTPTIAETLKERGERYGTFLDNALLAQELKAVMHSAPNWHGLMADQKEGLEIIASKIARALTGDPSYADNFHDIAGYAALIDARMAQPVALRRA